MPRYMVERHFPDGLALTSDADGAAALREVVAVNADEGVTWLRSFVDDTRTRTYCVYDAPSPEAIRSVATRNGLPVESVTEVSVLDPYFHH